MKNTFLLCLLFITNLIFGQVQTDKNLLPFIPKGYVIFDKIYGDLNKDGLDDCVMIIKGTDNSKIINHEYRGKLDRNRRGIIILFKKNDSYIIALKNLSCFSSENEEGGVYFPPDLTIEIKNGHLYINYSHGRYGYWQYNFRYQHADFELIGYDRSNGGVVIEKETSINFLTKKKQEKVNTNNDAIGGDEVFKETWSSIKIDSLIKLATIKDFDELDMSVY